jgi:hypothetical protein
MNAKYSPIASTTERFDIRGPGRSEASEVRGGGGGGRRILPEI